MNTAGMIFEWHHLLANYAFVQVWSGFTKGLDAFALVILLEF